MKYIGFFLFGVLMGAILLYMYLWYDAFNTLDGVLCNISTECEKK